MNVLVIFDHLRRFRLQVCIHPFTPGTLTSPITGRSRGTAKSDLTRFSRLQKCKYNNKKNKQKKPGFNPVFSVPALVDGNVICGKSAVQVGGMEVSCSGNERERWRLEGAEVSPE